MARSMTGFGRGEATLAGQTITVEIKSVNNRYCDVQVRLPRSLFALEVGFRNRCQTAVGRGKLDCSVNYEDRGESERSIHIDKALASAYDKVLSELGDHLGRPWTPDVRYISGLPDVMKAEDKKPDLEAIGKLLESAQAQALEQLQDMKTAEGVRLTTDILNGCQRMEELLAEVEERAPKVPEAYRARLTERIASLLAPEQQAFFDEQRLAAEVLFFADKADIHEEVIRLRSHLKEMKEVVVRTEPVGKKLDFFCQEVNREVNTIGSKANDLQLTKQAIEMKAVLETIREQVQNLE